MEILGIDIGGSAFKGAPVNVRTGRLLAERHRVEVEAPCPVDAGVAAARAIVRHFGWRGPVGIGFPGVVRAGRIGEVGNLGPEWEHRGGRGIFRRAVRGPLALINDADAAGLAEMRFGAGRGRGGTVLMLTLGTGIGSALFHDGRLFPNAEFGHLPWRGEPIERFASAAARKRLGLGWRQWAGRLNVFLAVMERIVVPDLIILGGGVSKKHDKWFHHLRTAARVVPARLQNDAGIIGAALAAAPAR